MVSLLDPHEQFFSIRSTVKVLVTGATGFVGSHVVDVLLERGLEVSYIARPTSNHRWMDGKNVQRVDGSLHDTDSLHTAITGVHFLHNIEVVI